MSLYLPRVATYNKLTSFHIEQLAFVRSWHDAGVASQTLAQNEPPFYPSEDKQLRTCSMFGLFVQAHMAIQ